MSLLETTDTAFDAAIDAVRTRMPYLPAGCDYQGRHPEAGAASTEVGSDDPPRDPVTAPWAVAMVLIALFSVASTVYLVWLIKGLLP